MLRKKSPVTRLGIDPGTFWLVAQRLNHYAIPGPKICRGTKYWFKFAVAWNMSVHCRGYLQCKCIEPEYGGIMLLRTSVLCPNRHGCVSHKNWLFTFPNVEHLFRLDFAASLCPLVMLREYLCLFLYKWTWYCFMWNCPEAVGWQHGLLWCEFTINMATINYLWRRV